MAQTSISPATSARMQIDGVDISLYSVSVNINSYGSVGSFEARTSLQYLRDAGIDIYTLSLESLSYLPVQIFFTDQYGNTDYLVFGGEYDRSEWSLYDDSVIITGRDWAGQLVDNKVVLQDQSAYGSTAQANNLPVSEIPSATYQIQNMTILDFISQVADNYGFTVNLVDPDNVTDQLLGPIFANNAVFTTSPRTIWEILVFLARVAGQGTPYEVFVGPDKTLNFMPASPLTPLVFTWKRGSDYYASLPGASSNTTFPLMDLHITHNPRRNSTFGVVVLSYNYATVSSSYGQLIYVNSDNYQKNSATWQKFGVSSPGWKVGKSPYGASDLLGSLGRPIYVIREKQNGDSNQVLAKAFSEALDIAKKEIIVEGIIDGYAPLLPMTPFTIDAAESDLLGFGAQGTSPRTFYINHVEHIYNVPQGSTNEIEGESGGYITKFTAWTLPPNNLNQGSTAAST